MPLSFTAVLLGRNQSRVTAQTVSTAPASLETVTINHGLGKTPDKVRAILRCIRAAISGQPVAVYLSANASVAQLAIRSENSDAISDWDFDCEVVHTVVR